ncbi:Wzz/FepE/Etk N-terminal domain-containing protein [Candidatus Pelagibacter sp.]|nr:Wzz/FepE/Etk N-terminal domain-containing protein [Candidatus Pelagibacter sp.]
MVKNVKIDNDEINLIDLMYTIWEGKWKIAITVVISLIIATTYQLNQTRNFTAITEIKPISSSKLNNYQYFNNLITNINNINYKKYNITRNNSDNNTNTNNYGYDKKQLRIDKVTNLKLLNMYIDILNDGSVFENAIRKFNLLDASQYNNDQEYNEAIIVLVSSIKILSPLVMGNSNKGNLETSYHTIKFTHHDSEKWKSILIHVNDLANKLVQKHLIKEYDNFFSFLKDEKKYQLENISTQINNYLIDYDRKVSDRILYLKEQSEIAKKLGIAKNTIEVQTFGNQNAMLSNVKTDSPFYLRGYQAIDKEIELIEKRNNKKAFIAELFMLEKEKRATEQDQTIERTELIFKSTLSSDDKNFVAASINAITTKFKYKDDKILLLAIAIGLIAGIFYVLISNAFQFQKVSRKKTT